MKKEYIEQLKKDGWKKINYRWIYIDKYNQKWTFSFRRLNNDYKTCDMQDIWLYNPYGWACVIYGF